MTMIVITLSSTPPMGLFRATTNKLNIVNTQRVLNSNWSEANQVVVHKVQSQRSRN